MNGSGPGSGPGSGSGPGPARRRPTLSPITPYREPPLPPAGGLSPIGHQRGLSAQAREEVRSAIVEGRLPAGSLTSVRALSEALGISRTPVREALVDLAKEGMVVFERSRGVRINDSKSHDILEIFQLRRMVEIPAIREAVLRFTIRDVRALSRELAAMRAHLDDERSFMHHDRAFHRVPLEVLGNVRLIAIVESLRDQTRVRGLSTVGRTRDLRAIVTEHQAIYAAARDGHAALAAQAMERHLLITEELLRGQADADADAGGVASAGGAAVAPGQADASAGGAAVVPGQPDAPVGSATAPDADAGASAAAPGGDGAPLAGEGPGASGNGRSQDVDSDLKRSRRRRAS